MTTLLPPNVKVHLALGGLPGSVISVVCEQAPVPGLCGGGGTPTVPAPTPTVPSLPVPSLPTITLPGLAFTRLAGGRTSDTSAATVDGDADLGAAVLANLAFTI